jgi:hypothetical protein
MRQYVPKVLLWLFIINLGIALGAGLYESRVVIPRWENIPPQTWPNTGVEFWVYVTTVPNIKAVKGAGFREHPSVLKNSLVPFTEPRIGTQSPSFAVFWSGFGCFRPSSGAQIPLATTFSTGWHLSGNSVNSGNLPLSRVYSLRLPSWTLKF